MNAQEADIYFLFLVLTFFVTFFVYENEMVYCVAILPTFFSWSNIVILK